MRFHFATRRMNGPSSACREAAMLKSREGTGHEVTFAQREFDAARRVKRLSFEVRCAGCGMQRVMAPASGSHWTEATEVQAAFFRLMCFRAGAGSLDGSIRDASIHS